MIERSKMKFTKKVFKMPLLDDNSAAINLLYSRVGFFF